MEDPYSYIPAMQRRDKSQSKLTPCELISSPMMINGMVKQMRLSEAALIKAKLEADEAFAVKRLTHRDGDYWEEKTRGESRTATTLLGRTSTSDELNKLDHVIKQKETQTGPMYRRSHNERRRSVSLPDFSREELPDNDSGSQTPHMNKFQVSKYSGPLHNTHSLTESEQAAASMADRLTNLRMTCKSDYSWGDSGSSARIRLGDGAILQNLYPSLSHVRLKNGVVERIDKYCQRMAEDREKLKEIALIKAYEYNQWSRTKPVHHTNKGENSKTYPLERLESKSIYPSVDTLRSLSDSTIGAKCRLFTYNDLQSKFSDVKFLKKMGFDPADTIYMTPEEKEPKSSYMPPEIDQSKLRKQKVLVDKPELNSTLEPIDDEQLRESDESDDELEILASDNEEDFQVESPIPEEFEQPDFTIIKKLELAEYRADRVIGSRASRPSSTLNQITLTLTGKPQVTPAPFINDSPFRRKKLKALPPDVHKSPYAQQLQDQLEEVDNSHEWKKRSMMPKFLTKSNSKYKPSKDSTNFQPQSENLETKQKFSQPVCLCPKLSPEALTSLYAPAMRTYMHTQGTIECRLHGQIRQSPRDKIILKSLRAPIA